MYYGAGACAARHGHTPPMDSAALIRAAAANHRAWFRRLARARGGGVERTGALDLIVGVREAGCWSAAPDRDLGTRLVARLRLGLAAALDGARPGSCPRARPAPAVEGEPGDAGRSHSTARWSSVPPNGSKRRGTSDGGADPNAPDRTSGGTPLQWVEHTGATATGAVLAGRSPCLSPSASCQAR